jgi:hypothetical protein
VLLLDFAISSRAAVSLNIYIYIYIWREREGGRDRERDIKDGKYMFYCVFLKKYIQERKDFFIFFYFKTLIKY